MDSTGEAADIVCCAKTVARVGETEAREFEVFGVDCGDPAMTAIWRLDAGHELNLMSV